MQAEALAGLTDENLNVLYFHFSDLMASIRSSRANHAYYEENCPDTCTLTDIEFTVAEAGKSLQQKAEQALLQNPDANAVQVDTDSVLLNGVLSAVQKSDRDLLIMAGEGDTPIMDLAREGNDNLYGIGVNTSWEGYGGIDAMNRLFNGEDPVPPEGSQGPGIQVWGPGHNIPESGPYVYPIDFVAEYEKAWGVSE
jgi:ribose transport system substrate-binding protein